MIKMGILDLCKRFCKTENLLYDWFSNKALSEEKPTEIEKSHRKKALSFSAF